MKGLFGVAGLLLALVITGLLVRQQWTATKPSVPSSAPGSMLAEPDGSVQAPAPSAKDQPQQFKQALEAAMQTPRPMPDDKQ